MPLYICHILIEDDVNSIDLVHRIFPALKQKCMSIVTDELHISNDSRVALNQIIVDVDCQEMQDNFVFDLSDYVDHADPTYRGWHEHL